MNSNFSYWIHYRVEKKSFSLVLVICLFTFSWCFVVVFLVFSAARVLFDPQKKNYFVLMVCRTDLENLWYLFLHWCMLRIYFKVVNFCLWELLAKSCFNCKTYFTFIFFSLSKDLLLLPDSNFIVSNIFMCMSECHIDIGM